MFIFINIIIKMQSYIFLFLLLTPIFSQQTPNENTQLNFNYKDLLTCIQEIQPLYVEITNLIELIKTKDYEEIIPKVYEVLRVGNNSGMKCLGIFPEVIEYLRTHIPFDWNEFMKCILDTQSIAEDIYELVQLIKNKDYKSIFSVVFQMFLDGNDVVKKCIQVFQKEKLLSVTYNLKPMYRCLSDLQDLKLKTQGLKELVELVFDLLKNNKIDQAYVTLAQFVVKMKLNLDSCNFIYIK
jgi:hypothetical protein